MLSAAVMWHHSLTSHHVKELMQVSHKLTVIILSACCIAFVDILWMKLMNAVMWHLSFIFVRSQTPAYSDTPFLSKYVYYTLLHNTHCFQVTSLALTFRGHTLVYKHGVVISFPLQKHYKAC
jgi:hypothetical protein